MHFLFNGRFQYALRLNTIGNFTDFMHFGLRFIAYKVYRLKNRWLQKKLANTVFWNTAELSLYLDPYIEAEWHVVKKSSYDSKSTPWTCYDYCMIDVLSSAFVVNMMFLLKELSSRNKTRKHHILKHGILIKRVMKMRICIQYTDSRQGTTYWTWANIDVSNLECAWIRKCTNKSVTHRTLETLT